MNENVLGATLNIICLWQDAALYCALESQFSEHFARLRDTFSSQSNGRVRQSTEGFAFCTIDAASQYSKSLQRGLENESQSLLVRDTLLNQCELPISNALPSLGCPTTPQWCQYTYRCPDA